MTFIRFTCAVSECTARFRFQKDGTSFRLTVAENDHNHDVSLRVISSAEIIRPHLQRMLSYAEKRSTKSLQKELMAIFGAKIGLPLIAKVRAQVLGRTKADEARQFSQLPSVISTLQAADPNGKFKLECEAGVFKR